jgi:phenylpropionate dioxygenase-like ring-hydroxylating dioxygenase large terminal subunit
MKKIGLKNYISPKILEKEKKYFSKNSWFLVCHKNELKNFNDYKTIEIFEIPIIIYNFKGEFKAFINVCPHRGSKIKIEKRSNSIFSCVYHGWCFNKLGKFISAPYQKQAFNNQQLTNVKLEPLQISFCGDFIFLNLSRNAKSLEGYLGEKFNILKKLSINFNQLIYSKNYTWNCNWKIAVENAIDEYHGPILHKDTFKRVLDLKPEYNSNKIVLSMTTPLAKNYLNSFLKIKKLFNEKGLNNNYTHHLIYPMSTVATTMGIFNFIQTYTPITESLTNITTDIFIRESLTNKSNDEALINYLINSSKEFNDKVFGEDKDVCEDMFKNMKKNFFYYNLGKFESRIKYFRKLVEKF